MTKQREEVLPEDCWDLEALYPDLQTFEKSLATFIPEQTSPPYWPTLNSYRGTLDQGPAHLKTILDIFMDLDRQLSKLYTYVHLKHDEDIANPKFKAIYEKILMYAHAFSQETAWFQPELISLPDEILINYLQSPLLKEYHFHIEKMIRIKRHTLSPEKEHLMALAAQALQSPYKAFNAMNDADFKFGQVKDQQGNEKPLTHASYGIYIRDQDRLLRERAFKQYHGQYTAYQNTLAETLVGQLQAHLFNARTRQYSSCLEAALFPKNIDPSVYFALIEAVNSRLDSLHRYMQLRKQVLNLPQLHLYDLYVPLTSAVDIKVSYQEAEDLVIESVAPLGSDYQNQLRKGLKEHRWVDRYENQNKRSGAYSSGSYDSHPYILMNYKDLLRDVFTLAHEVGHSMHSLYSRCSQPYQYSDYPIFLAEVASTFNEDLLMRLLLQKYTKPAERIFLLNQKIEDIRATLFRQTMFAEFELFLHTQVEQGNPLTPQFLNSAYRDLNVKYFGPSVHIDPEVEIEWARIPHFYYNFYVFQYATGISAALALSEQITHGDTKDRDAYLNFLKGGSSHYPIDLLKIAGIDMTSPAPVKEAIHKFDVALQELEDTLLNVPSSF